MHFSSEHRSAFTTNSLNSESDIKVPEGKPIVLRLKLRSAELFSIAFE